MSDPTSTPPEAPGDPGPRVGRDEVRDLAGLRRSRTDKKVAGVAGGLGRHLDVDPLLLRVALVVLVFFGGAGLIVYVACWLIVPLEGETSATLRLDDRSRVVALVLVGVLATLALLGDSLGSWGFPWPLAIIGTVVVVVMLLRGRNQALPPRTPVPGQSEGHLAPPPPPPPPSATDDAATYRPGPPAPPRRRGPLLFWYSLALVAIGVGVLGSLDLAGVQVAGSAYPALALITSGAMLVVGAFWGRPGGLILLGLLSAASTAAATGLGELNTGKIERSPLSSEAVLDTYDLDLGEIVLDLREVADPAGLDGRTIDLEVGLGRIEVIVPAHVDVTVTADVGAGDTTVFGDQRDGGPRTVTSDGGPDAAELTLDVRVGLGEIEITKEATTREEES